MAIRNAAVIATMGRGRLRRRHVAQQRESADLLKHLTCRAGNSFRPNRCIQGRVDAASGKPLQSRTDQLSGDHVRLAFVSEATRYHVVKSSTPSPASFSGHPCLFRTWRRRNTHTGQCTAVAGRRRVGFSDPPRVGLDVGCVRASAAAGAVVPHLCRLSASPGWVLTKHRPSAPHLRVPERARARCRTRRRGARNSKCGWSNEPPMVVLLRFFVQPFRRGYAVEGDPVLLLHLSCTQRPRGRQSPASLSCSRKISFCRGSSVASTPREEGEPRLIKTYATWPAAYDCFFGPKLSPWWPRPSIPSRRRPA